MGHNSTQQEILLMTGTSFSSRQWCQKDGSEAKDRFTEKERLEDACWHGIVKEILPELFANGMINKEMFLWQINEGNSFLELDLGETPFEKDRFYSIDPYAFLQSKNYC